MLGIAIAIRLKIQLQIKSAVLEEVVIATDAPEFEIETIQESNQIVECDVGTVALPDADEKALRLHGSTLATAYDTRPEPGLGRGSPTPSGSIGLVMGSSHPLIGPLTGLLRTPREQADRRDVRKAHSIRRGSRLSGPCR